jgi:hypothetical protein
MLATKRQFQQKSHGVILWERAKPRPASRDKTAFCHDIPPAPVVPSRWNYPDDAPVVRSTPHKLIEKHANKSLDDENGLLLDERKLPPTTLISPKIIPSSARPQSAISKTSVTEEVAGKQTSRPFSAPRIRQNNALETQRSHFETNPSMGIALRNKSDLPLPSTTADDLRSARHSQSRPSSGVPSSSREAPPSTQSRPLSSTIPPRQSPLSNSNPLLGSRRKKKKKSYFDFKRVPPPDLFQPTTAFIAGGPLPGSTFSSTAPAIATAHVSDKRTSAQQMKTSQGLHQRGAHRVALSVTPSSAVLGRSQDTARVHHLIDEMMMKLSSVSSSHERIAIKQEFTHLISRFAQQPSRGGDY